MRRRCSRCYSTSVFRLHGFRSLRGVDGVSDDGSASHHFQSVALSIRFEGKGYTSVHWAFHSFYDT